MWSFHITYWKTASDPFSSVSTTFLVLFSAPNAEFFPLLYGNSNSSAPRAKMHLFQSAQKLRGAAYQNHYSFYFKKSDIESVKEEFLKFAVAHENCASEAAK